MAGRQGKGSPGKGGQGSKRPPVRGGKGSPWANARSKAAASRSSGKKRPQVKPTPPAESAIDVDAERPPASAPPLAASVKLQKFLADAGFGSRRELERWIAAGRVEVNGSKATIGDRVFGNERIAVDGKPLGGAEEKKTPTPGYC